MCDAPLWALGRAADDATRPALEAALIEARAEVFRLESEIGAELPAPSKQKRPVILKTQLAMQCHSLPRFSNAALVRAVGVQWPAVAAEREC